MNPYLETYLFESQFLSRSGYPTQLWAFYYGNRLFSIAYTVAPYARVENVEFILDKQEVA